MAKNDEQTEQVTFQETEKIERKQAYEKACEDHEESKRRHIQRIVDFKNHILMIEAAIEEATELSGDFMKLTDRVKATRIGTPLDKVEYDKAAHDVDKANALYLGRLKQIKQILTTNLEYTEPIRPNRPLRLRSDSLYCNSTLRMDRAGISLRKEIMMKNVFTFTCEEAHNGEVIMHNGSRMPYVYADRDKLREHMIEQLDDWFAIMDVEGVESTQ